MNAMKRSTSKTFRIHINNDEWMNASPFTVYHGFIRIARNVHAMRSIAVFVQIIKYYERQFCELEWKCWTNAHTIPFAFYLPFTAEWEDGVVLCARKASRKRAQLHPISLFSLWAHHSLHLCIWLKLQAVYACCSTVT